MSPTGRSGRGGEVTPVEHARCTAFRRRLAEVLASDEGPDPVRAALLIAGEEYADLDVEREMRRLAAISAEAGKRAAGRSNPFARLDAVRAYMFEDLGFRGNADDYDDPRNLFLNQVLDRRTGIPITLSLVFIEAVRGAGFQARGIGLPGHFVVGVTYQGRDILVDPFHDGEVITRDDCRDLVVRATGRGSLFRVEMLEGEAPRAVVARLLGNLKRLYLARSDYGRALAAVDRLLMVYPGDPAEIRDRGFLLAHLGEPGAALADLETYLSLAPGAPDADSVRGRLAWLHRKLSETN